MSQEGTHKALQELVSFLEDLESCKICMPPSLAIDECNKHVPEWKRLMRQAHAALLASVIEQNEVHHETK